MRKIRSKLKELEWSTFLPGNSQVPGRILLNLEPIQDIMGLLVACKNEEDPIKNEGARVVTTLFINFSDAQGQLTRKSVMESCRNSNSSKL